MCAHFAKLAPMRILIAVTATLILAACSPASPPAEEAQTDASEAAPYAPNLDFEIVQAGTPVEGQWFFRGDEGVISAGFGLPQSEFQFVVSCEQATGKISVMSDHELIPDQDTQISIVTQRSSLDLPARSFNEGMAHVAADVAGQTELSRALAAQLSETQTRFGVIVAGSARVYPWSEELTRALENCR
jgi:hypothetical protein